MSVLRWLLPALLPAVLMLLVIRVTDREREPLHVVLLTFALGGVLGTGEYFLEVKAASMTGMGLSVDAVGQVTALLFVFALVAPLREAAKVAACWPAYRSSHFDEPYDGIVYSSAAALGFATFENALLLKEHPGGIWIARSLVALPAHVFFACLWGYGLGRSKNKEPGAGFPFLFVFAVVGHGFYMHVVWGRGPGALVVVLPLLLPMAIISFFVARDLRRRGDTTSLDRSTISRMSVASFEALTRPPSLQAVRDAFRRRERPIAFFWIVGGTFVTLGAMLAGVAASIAFGLYAHVDFSVVDEADVSTTAPVALLGAGLLGAFPLSGFLIAKASSLPSLLEPAVASVLAIVATLALLGLIAPVVVVFALALAPIAFTLQCVGAWVGRPRT